MSGDRIKALMIFFIAGFLSLYVMSYAQEEKKPAHPALERGIGQYKHENYDEALVLLKKAREEDPASTLAAYYLGLTYKQIQDYKEAVPQLRDAVTFDPKIKGALIELIDCLYQLNRLDEAKKWITEAEIEGIRPAEVAFLRGLVLLKAEDETSAVISFEKAKELDKSMEGPCDYQIGIAHLRDKNFARANEAFKEVVGLDPSSNMANFANQYIDAIKAREEATKPFRLSFGTAWQYDDNIVLRPSDDSVASDVTDKADSRMVYTARAQYEHRPSERFGLKGEYNFYLAKQNDLGFYDMVSNLFLLHPTLYFKNLLLTFPSGYSHTIVNDKAYLSSPTTSAICNYIVNPSNMAQAYVRFQYKDFLWGPSTPEEDRTGENLAGGLGWYLFYAESKGFVSLRYGMDRDWTDGSNWDYLGNRITLAALAPLMDKLNLTVSGDIYLQDFRNSHSVYGMHRKDRTYSISSLLAYKFYKESEVQLQYTFINTDSNIGIYGYNRNIFSVGVEVKF